MRRQIRLWIGGVSNACDPHFHSKGWGTPVFMIRVKRYARRVRLRRLSFKLGFCHAMGILPPMSAPKNKEAAGPTIFFEQADPVPPAERVVAFVYSHEEFRARPPAPYYSLAGPATWDACSIDRKHEDYRDECPKSEGPARIRSGGAGSGCEARHRGRGFPLRDGTFFGCAASGAPTNHM